MPARPLLPSTRQSPVLFADQFADLPGRPRLSDASAAALPLPVETESSSMTANDHVGLEQYEGLAPVGPESKEGYSQEPVHCPKRDLFAFEPLEHRQLMPESQDLDLK